MTARSPERAVRLPVELVPLMFPFCCSSSRSPVTLLGSLSLQSRSPFTVLVSLSRQSRSPFTVFVSLSLHPLSPLIALDALSPPAPLVSRSFDSLSPSTEVGSASCWLEAAMLVFFCLALSFWPVGFLPEEEEDEEDF